MRSLCATSTFRVKDGSFPCSRWGKAFFAAVCSSNTPPNAVLDGAMPYRVPGCIARKRMTGLQAVGDGALVHVAVHTTKTGGKAWEGN